MSLIQESREGHRGGYVVVADGTYATSPTRFFSVSVEKLEISSVRLFLERGAVVSDVVPPEVPLVLHLLLTDLAVHLPPHRVHVQDVLWTDRGRMKRYNVKGMKYLQIGEVHIFLTCLRLNLLENIL